MTDPADLAWALERLRPTPFGHFTEPVHLSLAEVDWPRRVYIRCRQWPNARYDEYLTTAHASQVWDSYELDTPHLPYITHPQELSAILLDIAG